MRHRFFGSSKFSTTGMHPSPFSTSMRSHSLTGASARTADRSFMYPLTGRSSCPLIAATSTSVMLTTPISRPSSEITGQLRWSCFSKMSPSAAIVTSGVTDTTRSARRITSPAVFCGGI